MKSWPKKPFFVVVWLLVPLLAGSCSLAFDPKATMYIVFAPEHTAGFLSDLGDIAKSQKLDPWMESLTTEKKATAHVFEAKGEALRIWAANVPLSQHECPGHFGIGWDPGQFMVTVYRAMWWRDWVRAKKLSANVLLELNARGYLVLPEPLQSCSFEYLRKELLDGAR
jgi:hypothetical protein